MPSTTSSTAGSTGCAEAPALGARRRGLPARGVRGIAPRNSRKPAMKQCLAICVLPLVFALGGPVPASAFSLEEPDPALPAPGTVPPGVTSWNTLGKTTVLWGKDG